MLSAIYHISVITTISVKFEYSTIYEVYEYLLLVEAKTTSKKIFGNTQPIFEFQRGIYRLKKNCIFHRTLLIFNPLNKLLKEVAILYTKYFIQRLTPQLNISRTSIIWYVMF